MKVLDGRNNVKIYNLTARKSLPDWLSERKRRKLTKRDVDIRRRIELIQDFEMPDLSNCVKVSPDGQYVFASGIYKPRIKCFEMSALSLKFERCLDAEVVEFDILSEDYSKMVILHDDRYLEFHNQGGRWFRTRVPKFGRDIAYHYPSCDLYVASSGSEVYRLNLHQGKFLNPLMIESPSVNKCIFNPVHYLFTCGTVDGRVEAWDPRSRHRAGVLDCARHMLTENVNLPFYKTAKDMGVTSLAYKDALTLAVGTQTGQILLYDIRARQPMLIKDHMDGFPIKDLEFHSSGMVMSLSSNALKIWEKDTGTPHTSIESDVKFNDLCSIQDSGMVFLATEAPKMQIYFLPSLGPAPKWCGHLDALIEELEEEDVAPAYDDYKFVTEQELTQLGLENLIGTNVLRAVMHGYYMDVRLYNKVKLSSTVLDKEHILKKKVKQKIAEQNERKIVQFKEVAKSAPDFNKEPFMKLREDASKEKGDKAQIATTLLQDPRFGAMFSKEEFNLDKETLEYSLIKPFVSKSELGYKQIGDSSDEEETTDKAALSSENRVIESASDSDSILSSDSERETNINEERRQLSKTKKSKGDLNRSKRSSQIDLSRHRNKSSESTRNMSNEFVSVDSMDDLSRDRKGMKEMSLAARLREEEDNEEVIQVNASGSREMKYTITDKKQMKFEKLRQQQRDHHRERKEIVRSTKSIKGKFRMNKPYS